MFEIKTDIDAFAVFLYMTFILRFYNIFSM
jgi:hypothetical protein